MTETLPDGAAALQADEYVCLLSAALAELPALCGFCCCTRHQQAEEQAAPEIAATLQSMHEFSCSMDAPQLLQVMAAGDEPSTAKLGELHQQASTLVHQLEQQLQQHIAEPLVAQWLRASGYDTYALMLRVGEFLAGVKDVQAAKRLAELVRVSTCHIFVTTATDKFH